MTEKTLGAKNCLINSDENICANLTLHAMKEIMSNRKEHSNKNEHEMNTLDLFSLSCFQIINKIYMGTYSPTAYYFFASLFKVIMYYIRVTLVKICFNSRQFVTYIFTGICISIKSVHGTGGSTTDANMGLWEVILV